MSSKDKPETIVVSAGRMTAEHFGAVNTPVYRTSTILHPNVESLKGEKQPYKYGRRGTPTQSYKATGHFDGLQGLSLQNMG